MKFNILTLFPEMFAGPFNFSVVKRAVTKRLIDINLINIRDYALDSYKTVDDKPYGGGAGMIMKVDVIDRALRDVKSQNSQVKSQERVILLDPRGKLFSQKDAKRLCKYQHLILVCGHYEGVDERVKNLVDESISIGNYILTGGEIPAMAIVDMVSRLIPGVIKKESTQNESFTKTSLEFPQYTRPPEYKGMKVPNVLLSGNHEKIRQWRRNNERKITLSVRI